MGAGTGVGAGVEVGAKAVAVDVGEGGAVAGAGLVVGERIAGDEAISAGEPLSVAAREGLGDAAVRDGAIVAVVDETAGGESAGDVVPPQAVSSVTTSRTAFRDSIRRMTFRLSRVTSPSNIALVVVDRSVYQRRGGVAGFVATG